VDDRTYPGKVGARGERVGGEIARDQLDAIAQSRRPQAVVGYRNDGREIEEDGGRGRAGTKGSDGPSARRSTDIEQLMELERP
jgi:hypothetical protein